MAAGDERQFRMLDGPPIPYWFAEAIYRVYHELWPNLSLEMVERRGGFGYSEIPYFMAALWKRRVEPAPGDSGAGEKE